MNYPTYNYGQNANSINNTQCGQQQHQQQQQQQHVDAPAQVQSSNTGIGPAPVATASAASGGSYYGYYGYGQLSPQTATPAAAGAAAASSSSQSRVAPSSGPYYSPESEHTNTSKTGNSNNNSNNNNESNSYRANGSAMHNNGIYGNTSAALPAPLTVAASYPSAATGARHDYTSSYVRPGQTFYPPSLQPLRTDDAAERGAATSGYADRPPVGGSVPPPPQTAVAAAAAHPSFPAPPVAPSSVSTTVAAAAAPPSPYAYPGSSSIPPTNPAVATMGGMNNAEHAGYTQNVCLPFPSPQQQQPQQYPLRPQQSQSQQQQPHLYSQQQYSQPHPLPRPQEPSPQRLPSQSANSHASPETSRAKMYARNPIQRKADVMQLTPTRTVVYSKVTPEYNNTAHNPPYAATGFIGRDNGESNPKFVRPTLYKVPLSQSMVNDLHIELGLVLSPLHQPLHAGEQVPVVQGRPPVRCHRCRGYLSCHARFTEGGQQWGCPLCGVNNVVSPAYFANLNARGQRVDWAEKAELHCGSLEYDVDDYPEYALRNSKNILLPTRPLHHLFLIDISVTAGRTFLRDYVSGIQHALQRMAELTPECYVSFITFGRRLHFYNFANDAPYTTQLCVGDVDNPFVPLPFTRLCWLHVGSQLGKVMSFLTNLPLFARDMGEQGCAVGAAVKAAMLVLADQHGGRVIVCAHSHPKLGLGSITPREQHMLIHTPREHELLRPMDGFWVSAASEAAQQQLSFDLFLFPTEYCEAVTLSQICHLTNGRLFYFPNYTSATDSSRVRSVLSQLAVEEAGYAGVLRVRCSAGLRVRRYRGHFFSQNASDMDLASITASSNFFVELEYESKLNKASEVFVQVALLYTTRCGHRRVRVHNCRLDTANTYTEMFSSSDIEATLFSWMQDTVVEAVNKSCIKARDRLLTRVEDLVQCYNLRCVSRPRETVLLLPSRLKLLPIFALCLRNCTALLPAVAGSSVDERVCIIFDLMTIPLQRLFEYLYPAMYALNTLYGNPEYGTLDSATNACVMPKRVQLLSDSVTIDGVYVLCDEQSRIVYLWIGSEVPPEVSMELFGVEDANTVYRAGGPSEQEFSERVRNILYELVVREDGMRRLIVMHYREAAEEAFFRQLKEDVQIDDLTYDMVLRRIHAKVRDRMTTTSSVTYDRAAYM